jgi:4'-phosphopantetheinyl transferase
MSLRKPYHGGRPFWMRTSGPKWNGFIPSPFVGAAHALLRGLLEAVGGRPARVWKVWTPDGNRPEAEASGVPGPQFSLTHTDGLVACAVSPVCPLGIDAEARKRRPVPGEVLEEILAPSELELLRSAPIERRDDLFLRLWTLREAYAKATGHGVRFPREPFALRLDPAAIVFPGEAEEGAAEWQLFNWTTTESHVLSLAVRSGTHRSGIIERTM